MKRSQIRKFISGFDTEHIDTVLLLDGFDDAFVGLDMCDPPRAVYSVRRIIETLRKDMSEEAAHEYYEFNIACAYVGEQTPLLIETP